MVYERESGWACDAPTSGVRADVAQDELCQGHVATQDDHPGIEDVVGLQSVSRHERELGSTSLDPGIGRLVRRGRLAGAKPPMPGAFAGSLEIDLNASTLQIDTGLPERPRQHSHTQIHGEVDRPVLDLGTKVGGGADVFTVDPPLDDARLDQVAGRDRAGEPREPLIPPVVVGEEGRVREERLRRLPPRREDLAITKTAPMVHQERIQVVHGEVLSVGERAPERLELGSWVTLHQLRRRRVLTGEVPHHVAVPPAGDRARLLPALRRRVLDRSAEALAFGVGGPDQLIPGEAHVGRGPFLEPRSGPSRPARNRSIGRMRVLVAPDKFRGTLSARQAAEAIATGWRRARPGDELDLAPMADGGEGTMEALVDALGGEVVRAPVHGPRDDPIEAAFGVGEGSEGRTAIVEMAAASGLQLLAPARRDPRLGTTRGTGELIRAALDRLPTRLIVGLGGSATNDGGAGMAQALGVRLLDAEEKELRVGGAALLDLARIDSTGLDPRLRTLVCLAASDVDNPLTGPNGASAVYGPQKGASAEDVLLLDRALAHLSAIVHRDLGIDPSDEPGAGAAGGLGFGLMAFLGARVRPGVDVVADALGLPQRMEAADLVITGEGKLDAQSLRGKTPAGVLRLARERSVSAVVVCGDAEIGLSLPGVPVVSLVERFGRDDAFADARRSLERVAEELADRANELVSQETRRGGGGER